jgi:hypothetical protein
LTYIPIYFQSADFTVAYSLLFQSIASIVWLLERQPFRKSTDERIAIQPINLISYPFNSSFSHYSSLFPQRVSPPCQPEELEPIVLFAQLASIALDSAGLRPCSAVKARRS